MSSKKQKDFVLLWMENPLTFFNGLFMVFLKRYHSIYTKGKMSNSKRNFIGRTIARFPGLLNDSEFQ